MYQIYYTAPDELAHHGIVGMKWGVRRYQNKDGSLTAEGKARVKSLSGSDPSTLSRKDKKLLEADKISKSKKMATARKAKEERRKKLKAGKLSPKEMTPKELQEAIDRMELEKKYTDAIKNTKQAQLDSSIGKRFVDKFINSSVDKLADQVAADLLAQYVKASLAKSINKAAKEETVYPNNKKK